MTTRRIGVVTTSYPRSPGDPAGSFVEGHVEALRALGHHVEVIAAGEPTPATEPSPPSVLRVPGSLFYRGGAPDLLERSPVRAGAAAISFTARLGAAVARRSRGWDTAIAHWLVPSALAALPTGAPLLAIAHGGDVHTLRRLGLLAPTLHALRLRGARLAFVSEDLRAIARGAAPRLARWLDDAVIQPMGLDLARFGALDREPGDPPMILVAARLVPIKGVDVALAAFAQLRARARLVIAGRGPELASLRERARGHAAIEFLGEVDTTRRDQLLRAASVVVVPSRVTPGGRTEGAPMIAVEALAAGVPVVASRVGGLGALEAIELIPPDNPSALARAIDRTLIHPPSPHELRRAVSHLDWRGVAERLLRNE